MLSIKTEMLIMHIGENEKSITMLLLYLFKALKFALLLQGLQVSFRAGQPVLPCD